MRATRPAPKPTALAAFTRNADDCAALLDHLGEVIARRRTEAAAEAADWSHAGSMAEVRSRLIQALVFIGGLDESEIETTLAELRETQA